MKNVAIALATEKPTIAIKTTKDKKIYPYLKWVMANARTSNKKLFLTGVGGVLYPPNENFDLLIQRVIYS